MSFGQPVKGRCPACGAESLFLGEGGYVTCAVLSCKAPDAPHKALVHNPHHGSPARAAFEEAWTLTHGDRKAAYGEVTETFDRYAKIWSGIIGAKLKDDLTGEDFALLMTGLKIGREANRQQSDNVVDAHGYLVLLSEVKASR